LVPQAKIADNRGMKCAIRELKTPLVEKRLARGKGFTSAFTAGNSRWPVPFARELLRGISWRSIPQDVLTVHGYRNDALLLVTVRRTGRAPGSETNGPRFCRRP